MGGPAVAWLGREGGSPAPAHMGKVGGAPASHGSWPRPAGRGGHGSRDGKCAQVGRWTIHTPCTALESIRPWAEGPGPTGPNRTTGSPHLENALSPRPRRTTGESGTPDPERTSLVSEEDELLRWTTSSVHWLCSGSLSGGMATSKFPARRAADMGPTPDPCPACSQHTAENDLGNMDEASIACALQARDTCRFRFVAECHPGIPPGELRGRAPVRAGRGSDPFPSANQLPSRSSARAPSLHNINGIGQTFPP